MVLASRPPGAEQGSLGAPLKGQPVEFSVQATLGYRVQQETPFAFNVQAQAFTGQTIKSEALRIEPELPIADWTMPESANRYFRLMAPPGGFKITYRATMLLSHPTENPAEVFEVPPGDLPLGVLTHLYPSGIASRIVSSALHNAPLGSCRQGISALRQCVIGFATMSITSAAPPTRSPRPMTSSCNEPAYAAILPISGSLSVGRWECRRDM
jgi:hypothetical protein